MRASLLFSLCCFCKDSTSSFHFSSSLIVFFLAETHQQSPENIINGITTNDHIPHEINLIQKDSFSKALTENKKITKLTLDLSFQILDFSESQQEPSNLFSLIVQPPDSDIPVNLLQLNYSSRENVVELITISKQGVLQLFKDSHNTSSISSMDFLATMDLQNSDILSLFSTSDQLLKSSLPTIKPDYASWNFDQTTRMLICGQGITCYIDTLVLWYDYSASDFTELAQLIASGAPLPIFPPNNALLNSLPPDNHNFLPKTPSHNENPHPPFRQTRMLGLCADATYYYYADLETCLSTCEPPYHVDSSITSFKACLLPYSATFIWNSQQVWKYSKQVAQFLAQISNIVYMGDSAGIRAAHSLRMFYYARYTDMTYPVEIQQVSYAWNQHFLPLGFRFEMPLRSIRNFNLDPIPTEFSKYGLVSSFLINFWAELLICSGIIVVWMFIKLIECCFYSKTFSTVRYRVTVKIRSLVQNLFLTQLYIVYGDLLFFSILEYRNLTSLQGLTGFSVLFSAFLLLGMVIGFLLHFLLSGKSSDVHRMAPEQELEKFLYDFQGNKVLFHDFKPAFSQQCFLLFLIFRDIFCSLMAALLFKDPVAQTTLILVANSTFMAYLLIKIPFKNTFHFFQQVIYEVITLSISVSIFILSVLDRIEAEAVQTKYNLSRFIIGLSLVIPFIISLFMISPIIYAIWRVFYEDYKRRKLRQQLRRQVWAAEQALPAIAVAEKGYYHSYHQTTLTYNQSYTDRPFLQQQSENTGYNSQVQNFETTFYQPHNDTMGLQNDSHPHEIQEGYAMTQPDVDPEPENPLQRALEKKRLYSVAIQEIEEVLSLEKDMTSEKAEILKMMNQVINETDEVSKIKSPRKSLAPIYSPPAKLNKSTANNKSISSKASKTTRKKVSPPKMVFTDYILTDDRIKLKKIESAKRAKRIKEAILAAEKAERARKRQALLHKSVSPERQKTISTTERSSRNPNRVTPFEKSSSYSPSKVILTDHNSVQKPQGILKNSPQRLAENSSRSRFSPLPTVNTIKNSPIPTQNTLDAPHNTRDHEKYRSATPYNNLTPITSEENTIEAVSRETRRNLEQQQYRSASPQKSSHNNNYLTPITSENTIEAPPQNTRDYEQRYRSASPQKAAYNNPTSVPSENTIEIPYNSRETRRSLEQQQYRSALPQKISYNKNLTPLVSENTIEAPNNTRQTYQEEPKYRSASPQKASNNKKNLAPIPSDNTIEAPHNSRQTYQEEEKHRSTAQQKPAQKTSPPKKNNIEILKYVDDSRLEVISVDEGRKSLRDSRTIFRGVRGGMNDTEDYLESVTPKGFSEDPRDKFKWSPERK